MWIKICANTNLADALAAVESGADAVGFVFAPSPRRVTAEQAAAISAGLPASAEKVGVFQDEPVTSLLEISALADLTGVQLHGVEDPEYIAEVRRQRPSLKIIKGLHPAELAQDLAVDAILIDSGPPGARGGTGKVFDWRTHADAIGRVRKPVIIAGGLTPDNVSSAISVLHPFGVDVASGVEARPGTKDHARVQSFIRAARSARH